MKTINTPISGRSVGRPFMGLAMMVCLGGSVQCSGGGSDSDKENAGGNGAGGSEQQGGSSVGTSGSTNQGGSVGSSTQGGQGAGVGGAGGSANTGGSGGAAVAIEDKRPLFSFFVTSQEGILSFAQNKNALSGTAQNPGGQGLSPEELAKQKGGGLGGDLGGLIGADRICTTLAQRANPGDKKIWRAFLSAANGPVNAIDRIGKGPWYNFKGVLLAKNLQDLVPGTGDRGRPTHYSGAEENGPLLEMFTDENGDPVSVDTAYVDNHDTLTGSDQNGKYRAGYSTCNDWTSADENAPGMLMIGHAWPRSDNNGRHWISDHPAGGCGRGIDTRKLAGNNTKTVGSGGGYGGFYCFAVTGM